ncbi:MAG: hypothetical protein H6661_10650 [Ardenticatenaceae bacterium]|nr:hypothetical protein [Ardenticatenaceae bacterium]
MSDQLQGEIDLQEFRQMGYQLVDWIADYLGHPEQYPVLSRSQPGDIKAQLPPAAPEEAEPLAAIIADFEKIECVPQYPLNHSQLFRLLQHHRFCARHPGRDVTPR